MVKKRGAQSAPRTWVIRKEVRIDFATCRRSLRALAHTACFQSLAGSNVRDVYDFKEFLAAGQYGKVYRV